MCPGVKVGDLVLVYWRWCPSLRKAKTDQVQDVLDFFNDLEHEDCYKNGQDGPSYGDMENEQLGIGTDKRNWITYSDSDYLLLVTQKISNGYYQRSGDG